MRITFAPGYTNKTRAAFGVLVAALLLSSLGTSASAGRTSDVDRLISVIVRGVAAEPVQEAVESVGGRVTRDLSIIGGVSAEVPSSSIPRLRSWSGITQVEPDAPVAFEDDDDEDDNRDATYPIQKIVNSDDLWRKGGTGDSVTVALLDTGVYAAHPDLQGSNGTRVIACEDLSHEAGTEAHCADTFGHGTFMAGLIAGNGQASRGKYVGAAPNTNIVSVKAAGFDGSTDVSTILAGIQWVVSHKDEYGIRVLNLSLGSDSSQDYRVSPLNYAVERAWEAGIVVVVSAGNSGPNTRTVMKPGDDPFVITVGASNDEGSMDIRDDKVPVFSSRGPTRANNFAKPDLVSPGVHTVSLRSPGSAIDQQFGSTAVVDGNYFKGTGTSMSTATVTGVVAQMLDTNPALNPNQVKYRLMATARGIAETDPFSVGAGLVDAYAAAMSTSLAEANQGLEESSGLGLLGADRGSLDVEVSTPAGAVALEGEVVAQAGAGGVSAPYASAELVGSDWENPASWDGTQWKNGEWLGTQWKGTQWKATVWDGTQWKGTQWKNADWDGTQWKNVDWDGTQWKGTQWKSAWYAAAWD